MTASPTRVGVFTYTRADGTTFRELRHPDEVFHPDSLASLEDVPVTLGVHPAGGMKPHLFKRLSVGHVRAGTVRADGEAVRAALVLADQNAIAFAEQHKNPRPDLSAGYDCLINPTPGVWNGQPFDQSQEQIRYHHVAMLSPGGGRAGKVCRLDSADNEIPNDEDATETETPMKITIGGKVYEGEAQVQAEVLKLEARADSADARVRTLTETVARADAEAAVVARNALEAKVKSVMGPGFSLTKKGPDGQPVALTSRELRVAVIQRADSAFSEVGRDDVYLEARFDATLATSSKASAVIDALNFPPPAVAGDPSQPQVRGDAADDKDGPAARVRRIQENARKNGVALAE